MGEKGNSSGMEMKEKGKIKLRERRNGKRNKKEQMEKE